MNNLNHIVNTFSKEEQQHFISFLEKKNKRRDTKNVQLFKLLLSTEFGPKDLMSRLYGEHKTAAYHALRKRLYQSIIDFIANTSLEDESSNDMQIIKLILASRSFLLQKQYQVAYKVLDKAESIGQEHQLYPILNEIYHTKIQYAHAIPNLDLNSLIEKFNANQAHLILEDKLNIVYAQIRQTLVNMTYKGEVVDFQTILNEALEQYDISIDDSLSFKSLYQLMTIVSISAFVTNDYLRIEPFLLKTYTSLILNKTRVKLLYYHIQVLYLIANTLFRNKKFDQSLKYLEKMHEHMMLKHQKYYNVFKLKYNLLLALNYNYSNRPQEAINVLQQFILPKHPDLESLLDIYLSLVTFYFQQGEFKKAFRIFSKFYHTDNWYMKKAGKEWVIKKNLIEILLHIELGNTDLVDSRLLSFKRTYFDYLSEINQERAITYVNLIEDDFLRPESVVSQEFYDKVENSFEWIHPQKEDIFVMSFYAWLKSKMDRSPLYNTTLELIKKAGIVKE